MVAKIFYIFWKSSTFAIASAGFNMISTIFIVRFLGPEVFANQIVDLAQLALLMILLEVLPANFLVFKVQDDARWRDILIVQLVLTAVLILFVIQIIGTTTELFNGETWLISSYALMVILKRFNDINLQSQGLINYLFLLDFAAAILRLGLIITLYILNTSPELTVWLSLLLSAAVVQPVGAYRFRGQAGTLIGALSCHWTSELRMNWAKIIQYYPSTALKRVADSMIPILADQFLPSKENLAVFLLAFRSLSFVNVFSRIFEALLNHRANLAAIKTRVMLPVTLLGAVSHIGAFIMSIVLIWLAGQTVNEWLFVLILTAMAWPNTAIAVSRAQNLSKYSVWPITIGYGTFVAVFFGMTFGFYHLATVTPLELALSILVAQTCSWIAMHQGEQWT